MGQKVNPNIYRLGINKTWNTEFFEKKNQELSLYTFKDLAIKSYIEKFLNNHNLILHSYKIHYNNKNLNIFIYYYIPSNFIQNKTSPNKNRLVIINKTTKKQQNLFKKSFVNKKIVKFYFKKSFSLKKINSFNFNRLEKINNLKELVLKNSYKKFLKGLNLFTNQKYQISATFHCINKNFNLTLKQKNSFKQKLLKLQKFKNNNFFNESINVLFITSYIKNSSSLLSQMISDQFKKLKRHKFFLTFVRKSLNLFIKSNFSKIKGIKIMAKGRINGAARARHKIIKIGDVPIQTISSNLSYSQTTCHNSNGSYGIKVWIIEKIN